MIFPIWAPQIKFPSGDVFQNGWLERWFNFTINIGAGDAEKEKDITEEVASYGSQLGTLLDAMDVLCRRIDPAGLNEADSKALERLRNLRAAVEWHKEKIDKERERAGA